MNQLIPSPLLSVCAEIVSQRETHATLDSLFTYAGVPGDPPQGSKQAKALEWLRRTNIDKNVKPLDILGRLIENYMEEVFDSEKTYNDQKIKDREKLVKTLAQFDLQYVNGGKLIGSLGSPSKTLEEFIRDKDLASIDIEFNRALSNVETNPRESVSASSNILESICKIYIDSKGLDMPAKQDIKNLWMAVRKHLGFDPSVVEDQDLQRVLSGLISIVDGIGSLRTHASSAHGAGKKIYNLEPRHVRLAVHSAHTIALFVLESWHKKKQA
mgnify:CR=1 FL=1